MKTYFNRVVLPALKMIPKGIFQALRILGLTICILIASWIILLGLVWVLGAAADALTSEAVVFIDPADGVLEQGEEWKIHRMVTWSDEIKNFVEVPSSSPIWDQILERGDYAVSYAWDQSGTRFPPMPE